MYEASGEVLVVRGSALAGVAANGAAILWAVPTGSDGRSGREKEASVTDPTVEHLRTTRALVDALIEYLDRRGRGDPRVERTIIELRRVVDRIEGELANPVAP